MESNTRRLFIKKAGLGLLAVPAVCQAAAHVKPTSIYHSTVTTVATISLNVRDFGAVGDGVTKDTLAIQQAIDRCGILGGGQVLLPAGNYLTGAIQLRSNIMLRLEKDAMLSGSAQLDDYPVTQVRWEGKWIPGHTGLIYAIGANNIGITGLGKIAGNPTIGGRPSKERPLRLPALIEPIDCSNVLFEGFSTEYRLMWSIHLTYCNMVVIKNLTIRSSGPNGDGIDVDSCKHVTIDGCDIATGDDCISLKSGRGMEGYTLKRATEDVKVSNCTFADSIFACIGVGSETSGGIRNLHVEHCKFTEAKSFAIYLKSNTGRGAFIENLTFNDLDIAGTKGGFLKFNLAGSGLQDEVPVPGDEGVPALKNFVFNNIRVTDVPVLIDGVGIHPDKVLDGLVITNISGTCGKGITLANIKNAKLMDISVTGFNGPLLKTNNVTGSGLRDAVDIAAPKFPPLVPVPASSFILK